MESSYKTKTQIKNKTMKRVSQGAEAIIYLDKSKSILKDRFPKQYRIKEIDERLRKLRTRREAKILAALSNIGFPSPKLVSSDDKNMKIEMEHIKGEKVRDILEKSDYKKISEEIGKNIAVIHDKGIIHGDLTTSNMILKGSKLYFIDFGLGFTSKRAEDKAVDLHLIKEALEAKHFNIAEQCF